MLSWWNRITPRLSSASLEQPLQLGISFYLVSGRSRRHQPIVSEKPEQPLPTLSIVGLTATLPNCFSQQLLPKRAVVEVSSSPRLPSAMDEGLLALELCRAPNLLEWMRHLLPSVTYEERSEW